MSAHDDAVERAAFAIFSEFISRASGTLRQKRGRDGRLMWDGDRPLAETPYEAASRRWLEAPELTRARFRQEAALALEAAA